jgi:hypothetical protein
MVQLDIISRNVMVIGGFTMVAFGTIGNILNIWVFAIWCRCQKPINIYQNNTRTSNSPLYLLTSSIANLIVIVYSLTTRILYDGLQYPITQYNVIILCKFRYFVLHTADVISLTCLCLATFDRYLVSSPQVRLRQWSTTRQRTKLIILFIICLIGLHSIPLSIYYNASNAAQCVITDSPIYLSYYRYTFQIFLHGLIPLFFFSLFGFLTYKQLKMMKNRQNQKQNQNQNQNVNIDKQLSRMLLLISIAIVLSAIPYSVETIYYLLFASSSQQQTSYILLFHIISSLLFYTNAVCSFYIYYISTPNFRIQVKKIILCKTDVNRIMNNRVNTITIANHLQQ